MVPLYIVLLLLLCRLLCCVVRDRLVVRDFMRADADYFFSGVLDVYFCGSLVFCLSIFVNRTILEQLCVNL